MEISGIGGYERDFALRSSLSSVNTALTDATRMPDRPPASRSVGDDASDTQDDWRFTGNSDNHLFQRTLQPIVLDLDLPSTARTSRSTMPPTPPQRKSSSRFRRKSVAQLANLQPSVSMSDERRAEYKKALEGRIASALLKSQAARSGTNGIFGGDDPKNWKLHVNKPNKMTMFRRRQGVGAGESSNRFVATGRVSGSVTLEDLEYGLYSETTPDERALNAYWYGEQFLDAGVLEAYETRTEADPFQFFGVKWLLSGPLQQAKFIAPRVSSFVQFQKTVVDEFGEKVLVRVTDSVPEDVVKPIPNQGKISFVPLGFAAIYVYRYDPKHQCVTVFCEGHLQPAMWLPDVNHSLLACVMIHLEHIADAKYITKHGLLFPHEETSPMRPSESALSEEGTRPSLAPWNPEAARMSHGTPSWVPDTKRKLCVLCFKSFSLLRRRRRHHCRMCGEVVCAACMTTLPLIAPPAFDGSKDANFPLTDQPPSKMLELKDRRGLPVVHAIKMCSKCLLGLRQERRAMTAGVGTYYFTEGMRLHYEQMQAAITMHNNNNFSQSVADVEEVESGYLDSSLGDGTSIVDATQYSKRIEKLRQEHMAREKLKLRSGGGGKHEPILRSTTTSISSGGIQFDDLDFEDLEISQVPVETRRHSFSDRFERVERSIAEQEALIRSIQYHQRLRASANLAAQEGAQL